MKQKIPWINAELMIFKCFLHNGHPNPKYQISFHNNYSNRMQMVLLLPWLVTYIRVGSEIQMET